MKRLAIPLMLVSAWAQASDPQNTDWLACARVAEATARLACYDAQAARAGLAPAAPAPLAKPANQAEQAAFGMQPKPSEQVQAVESSIAGLFEGWGPRTVFQLANGQRWKVSDGSSAYLHRQDPKVTIRRGALGSFWFEVQGSNAAARVQRVD